MAASKSAAGDLRKRVCESKAWAFPKSLHLRKNFIPPAGQNIPESVAMASDWFTNCQPFEPEQSTSARRWNYAPEFYPAGGKCLRDLWHSLCIFKDLLIGRGFCHPGYFEDKDFCPMAFFRDLSLTGVPVHRGFTVSGAA